MPVSNTGEFCPFALTLAKADGREVEDFHAPSCRQLYKGRITLHGQGDDAAVDRQGCDGVVQEPSEAGLFGGVDSVGDSIESEAFRADVKQLELHKRNDIETRARCC